MVTIGGKLKVGFILFMVSTAATAALQGQDLRLVDPTSSAADLKPGAVERLPLEPAQRAAVRQAIKARDYPRAETILVDEINKSPKAPQLLTFLGSLFFLDGKYLNTAIAMKKAEAIEPLDDRNRFTLALSYIILNQCDWARPELEKLARANPREPLYPYWLGRLDFDAQQFKAAAANLRKALELDPTFMKAYDNLGLTYEVLAQYDDAIRIYHQALDLNRRQLIPSPWPPLNFGTLLIKLDRLKEAETCLQEALRYEPRFAKAHFQMGLLLEKEKKDEEAIRELSRSAEYDPAYPEPHFILGRIYQRIGDKAKADAEWQTFQKLKKENPHERPH
jgi:tetratricopeptide (TPR) repeat protein